MRQSSLPPGLTSPQPHGPGYHLPRKPASSTYSHPFFAAHPLPLTCTCQNQLELQPQLGYVASFTPQSFYLLSKAVSLVTFNRYRRCPSLKRDNHTNVNQIILQTCLGTDGLLLLGYRHTFKKCILREGDSHRLHRITPTENSEFAENERSLNTWLRKLNAISSKERLKTKKRNSRA